MTVKKVIYSREYIPKLDSKILGIWPDYITSNEDLKLRDLLIKKFGGIENMEDRIGNYEGFDGKTIYNFHIDGHAFDKEPYKTKVEIKKKGDEEVINNELCDLEKFLIKNDFIRED
ncbi:MAG: hypothetical protein M1416_00370 [Candidatus Pacearchaeota archaeon]|nr:hypothetical protein [Candidatus Pacearchaeota archaeon]